jgi:hypothetical protein
MSAATQTSNIFDSLIETEAEETARLVRSPLGSLNHDLSAMPVTIREDLHGLVVKIQMPDDEGRSLTVVPVEHCVSGHFAADGIRRRRNDGYWKCIVIASDMRTYVVGGYDLSIPESQLVRGERIAF